MSGFIGNELGALLGGGGNGEARTGNLLSGVMNDAGGVQGILAKAEQAGLGDKVRSWIGNGQNWPVSPAEIEQIFPPQQLDAWASQHGVPSGAVSQVLASVLPHAVDHVTPDGGQGQAQDQDQNGAGDDGSQAQAAPGAGENFDFGGFAKKLFGG